MKKHIDQNAQPQSAVWHSRVARSLFERMKRDIYIRGSISDNCKKSLHLLGVSPHVIPLLSQEFCGCEDRISQPRNKGPSEPLWPMIENAVWDAAGEEGIHSLYDHCSTLGSKYTRVYRSGCEHLCFRNDLKSEFSDTQNWKMIGALNGACRTNLYETNGPNSIKLIIRSEKRARFYERLYVKSNGFPIEEPLGYRMRGTYNEEKIGYVFTSFIENSVVLDEENISHFSKVERLKIASMIIDILAQTHNKFIVHTHPHNGNFLYIPSENRIVMIDSPYKFGDEAKKHRLDMLLYFLLRANGQRIVPEIDGYWHKLHTVRLIEKEDITPLLRQYLISSNMDCRNLHTGAQQLSYGTYPHYTFEYTKKIYSLESAVKYLIKRLEFSKEYYLHG